MLNRLLARLPYGHALLVLTGGKLVWDGAAGLWG